MHDFLNNDKTRSTQRISKHHFTAKQLISSQGGGNRLKNDAIADIPLSQMPQPLRPVGIPCVVDVATPRPSSIDEAGSEPRPSKRARPTSTHDTSDNDGDELPTESPLSCEELTHRLKEARAQVASCEAKNIELQRSVHTLRRDLEVHESNAAKMYFGKF